MRGLVALQPRLGGIWESGSSVLQPARLEGCAIGLIVPCAESIAPINGRGRHPWLSRIIEVGFDGVWLWDLRE